MIKNFINTYYKLLDEKLENWTIVVLLIAFLIVSASFITKPETNAIFYVKSNILEKERESSFIEIKWVKYKITLEEF